jgi:hypothetical protein
VENLCLLRGDAAEIVPRHLQVGSLPGALDMERKKRPMADTLYQMNFRSRIIIQTYSINMMNQEKS